MRPATTQPGIEIPAAARHDARMADPRDDAVPAGLLGCWAIEGPAVAAALEVVPGDGLANAEAAHRLALLGPNRLAAGRRAAAWRILLRQLESLTTLLLVAAAIVAFLFDDWPEGIAIAAVLVLNSAIGFTTELKATRSIEALRLLGTATARVRRAGGVQEIAAEDLVPGDVVLVEAGDLAAADLRLLAAWRLQSDESQLTGESLPVDKGTAPVPLEAPLADRSSLLFKGAPIVRGSGEGVVVATGARTELGRIAALAEQAGGDRTPLERKLEHLGRVLAGVVLGIAAATTLVGVLSGRGLFPMIETGIALAVAAVPEGLPIVATLALARGVWRMARRDALVNRLSAVETLGAVTLICTDKTGTLTENRMTLTHLAVAAGDVAPDSPEPAVRAALEISALCSNASLDPQAGASGDPLELALLTAASRNGIDRQSLLDREPEVREEAFDAGTRMMATFHRSGEGFRVAVKGAPEAVLAACVRVLGPQGVEDLGAEERRRWLERNQELAGRGFRLVALAGKDARSSDEPPYEGLTWIGLAVLEDPPRPGAREAVAACRRAGIRVVMVTGDQEPTARSVAESVGLATGGAAAFSGAELRRALAGSPEERRRVAAADLLARVDPEQKLDLIALHQEAGAVVAMTGDGINDAPALRKADVGIAMGRRGSQVAREAAAVTLKDDSFATLVAAIRQGRVIFSNIRRFIVYLLSCNTAEVAVVGTAFLIDSPLPVLPLQLLLLNLVTDVFPALALGLGEGDSAVMDRPPRDPAAPLLGRRDWAVVAAFAALLAGSVFGALAWAFAGLGLPAPRSLSVAFLTLAFGQLWHVFNMRPPASRRSAGGPWANGYVWGALGLCSAMLLLAVYVPFLARVLELTAPGPSGWVVVAVMSSAPLALGSAARHAAGFVARRSLT
jgi:P-type Ca2+ transporter type 2C